ncbi:Dehydrogenase azaJ [Fusarium oxysporum f. sp. albedinis]|nr:Dehydrogenase azaJ [Fusarium oxysporum f. sp. albedinis]
MFCWPGKLFASDDHAGFLVNNGLTYTGEECSAYETFADQPTNQPVAANIPNPVIQWINATNRVRKKKTVMRPLSVDYPRPQLHVDGDIVTLET